MPAALKIDNLSVRFSRKREYIEAVRDVSLEIAPCECVALIGESGSGKTQLFQAVMQVMPPNAAVLGRAMFAGTDLLKADQTTLNRLRGAKLAMIAQDPMTSLTPHLTVGTQLAEVLVQHAGKSWREALEAARRMLDRMHISDPGRRLHQYPHELSGGMRQRVAIGIGLMCEPTLLIADEPTTALDVTVQGQILEVFRATRRDAAMALVLISHDLGVVAGIADRIAVMYAGRVVEIGAARAVFGQPRHPYTAALLACMPQLQGPLPERMASLPGQPPRPEDAEVGCAFAPRCPRAAARCHTERPQQRLVGASSVACHFPWGS